MKKELVFTNIKKLIDEIDINKDDKHSSVNCSIIIVYKIKNKAMKFMQNFSVEVPNGYKSANKVAVFCSAEKFSELKVKYEDGIIEGTSLDPKKLKRSLKWALIDGDFNIEKYRNNLNRKAILPNNSALMENFSIEEQIEKVLNSQFIKLTQMNNSFSFKAGSLLHHNSDQLFANVEAVYNFISGKLGNLIARVYINKTMKKSSVICIRS